MVSHIQANTSRRQHPTWQLVSVPVSLGMGVCDLPHVRLPSLCRIRCRHLWHTCKNASRYLTASHHASHRKMPYAFQMRNVRTRRSRIRARRTQQHPSVQRAWTTQSKKQQARKHASRDEPVSPLPLARLTMSSQSLVSWVQHGNQHA